MVGETSMKIYVRERQKVGEGVESPKYRIVAVTGGQIQIEATHFRKFEIEIIAKGLHETSSRRPEEKEALKRIAYIF
jgi:hypothetical protein